MENPKSFLRRFFELALLAGVMAGLVWVLRIRQPTPQQIAEPTAVLIVESPYPPPPTTTPIPSLMPEDMLAYLPPITPAYLRAYPEPLETLSPTPTHDYCTGMGQWLTFADPVAGYTISYPGEALLPTVSHNTPQADFDYHSFDFNIVTNCYKVGCTGFNTIGITVYPNPNGLDLQPFIEQEFELYTDPFLQEFLSNYEETGHFTQVGSDQSIKAFRVEAGVTIDGGPDVFISNGNKVIMIWASRTGKEIGPYDPPCAKTLEILDTMLATLILTTPSP